MRPRRCSKTGCTAGYTARRLQESECRTRTPWRSLPQSAAALLSSSAYRADPERPTQLVRERPTADVAATDLATEPGAGIRIDFDGLQDALRLGCVADRVARI